MRIVGQDAEIHFGEVDADEGDWRTELPLEEGEDDEEELDATPQDVIDILGFDYRDEEPEEESTVSLNTAKAILILNAKKGWTDAARKKAAATRKQKSKGGAVEHVQKFTRDYARGQDLSKKTKSGKENRKKLAQKLLNKVGGLNVKKFFESRSEMAKRQAEDKVRSAKLQASKKQAKRNLRKNRNMPMGGYD